MDPEKNKKSGRQRKRKKGVNKNMKRRNGKGKKRMKNTEMTSEKA